MEADHHPRVRVLELGLSEAPPAALGARREGGSRRHAEAKAELSGAHAVDVPFALALTHLVVARGWLDDVAPLTFLLDSGLQDEQGAGFAAPPATLAAAGIPIPETTEEVRESGAGHVPLQVARFPIRRLGLGSLVQHDLTGFYGVFPDAWREAAGFSIHGLVSHGFLRRYASTLDFESMTMSFVSAGGYVS